MSEWGSGDNTAGNGVGVTVVLPSGEHVSRTNVTAQDIKGLAQTAGVNKFDVKDGNGNLLTQSQFPIVSGVVHIEEYNEVKGLPHEDVWFV